MLLIIALTICSLFSGVTHVSGGRPVTIEAVAADECEGDACSQVTVTFEESKERYKVQNNSSDHWVRSRQQILPRLPQRVLNQVKSPIYH
jgi:hypothetical protein